MFKKFFPNKEYSFNLDGSYRYKGLEYPHTGSKHDLQEIVVNDRLQQFTKKWLGLMSHFEVDLPGSELRKVVFLECSSRVLRQKSGHLMFFNSKVRLSDGFFVIPGFTRFAITEAGEVKSLRYGKILRQRIGPYGYPEVSIYDADKGAWISVNVHILLARTFIRNPDPSNKFFVNHIDGNKLNFELTNLEWVTSIENQRHAFESGLRTDNKPCKVLDSRTLEIKTFSSIGLALKVLGFKVKSANLSHRINGKIVPALLGGRYEIKLEGDDSDWFYNTSEAVADKVNQVGPFEAKNIATGAVTEAGTIIGLSRKLDVSVYTIDNVLRNIESKSACGYLFRPKSDKCWETVYTELVYFKSRRLKVINNENGEEIILPSIRKGCHFTGADKRTLKNRLRTNKPYKNFTFEEIE